jgi:ubiquinone/menaquinone biosynthesis C-methylase UbiE
MRSRISFSIILALLLSNCAQRTRGYQQTFQPILQFMDYRPGMTFADVGAGSGLYTIQMATLMSNSAIYIQDIDTTILNNKEINKFIDTYSKQTNRDLRKANDFHLVIGDVSHTNLPNSTFDRIYSNATVHNFTNIDSIMVDLGRKLKPGGTIFFRDSFKGDHKEGTYCSDPKCGRPLLTIDEFLAIMKKNDFKMVNRAPDMSGYPVFGFSKN